MATFQSRDDVVNAYQTLLKLEQTLQQQLTNSSDDPDWDELNQLVQKETDLMDSIDNHEALDPLAGDNPDQSIQNLIKSFAELREQNRDNLARIIEETEHQLESLDQADKLMKHYLQGESRFDPSMSQRFEREV